MSVIKISASALLLATLSQASQANDISLVNSTWKYNKQSAYALQHDDYCGGTQDSIHNIAVPELKKRGLTASFGVIARSCWPDLWDKAKQYVDDGFTLYNHSMRHTPAFKPTWESKTFRDDWKNELDIGKANERIKAKTGYTPTLMAMPYDIGSDESYKYVREHPELIAMRAPVENNGVWAGNQGINDKDFYNGYKLKVSLFYDWSPYWKLGKKKRLGAFLQDVISQQGFGVQYFHGINDDSYFAVSKTEYLRLLDKLKQASDTDLVWVSDAGEIVNYRYAREYCTLTLEKSDAQQQRFSIQGTVTQTQLCSQVNRELTAMGDVEQKVVAVEQGGEALAFVQQDGKIQFEYQTDKGDITLLF
ncbi:hypothetical protein CW745_07110 [Psychromonas sp. psych-6C06]|uniref:polysaccharide deacetylase family protein n=1 Tax=Psychromonas sp. psych-6C06 TaxID=2058089 RepID=UPI000C31DF2F|nr:polysaccharide deacetylase family protein [Psychromonas sp. psych-6C06]PKF62158.1 hypothetical protein CW745_07110 [Psychromonas sp. psych-6C06]